MSTRIELTQAGRTSSCTSSSTYLQLTPNGIDCTAVVTHDGQHLCAERLQVTWEQLEQLRQMLTDDEAIPLKEAQS